MFYKFTSARGRGSWEQMYTDIGLRITGATDIFRLAETIHLRCPQQTKNALL